MNNTIDLSFLLSRNNDSYFQHWRALGEGYSEYTKYSVGLWGVGIRFIWCSRKDYYEGEVVNLAIDVCKSIEGKFYLETCLLNGHTKSFPLNAVPMESPFKKKELAQRWREFIDLFRPVEVEDIPEVYAYDE